MDPENGAYSRRRIDELTDQRIRDLGREVGILREQVRELDAKVDALSNRIAWLFGGLAVFSFVLNIVGPAIADKIVR